MIRAIDRWLIPYLKSALPHAFSGRAAKKVFISLCDHFEPLHDTDLDGALSRLDTWLEKYPTLVTEFEQRGKLAPRHTFFFPIEQYDSRILDRITEICRLTNGEVEVHLHHQNDNEETLEEKLLQGIDDLMAHGLLSRDSEGKGRYGFIHGNWALNNCDPRKKSCGVDNEIPILRRTGCYADFTMPAAPHPAQVRRVNSVYYSTSEIGEASITEGPAAERNVTSGLRDDKGRLLLVQGPLALNWKNRKSLLLPKIENGDLTGANPPTRTRFDLWRNQRIDVKGRPEWTFIKLHTHGGIPPNFDMLLGPPMREFLTQLEGLASDDQSIHFVTSREMTNLIHFAEDGVDADPLLHKDHVFSPPPFLSQS